MNFEIQQIGNNTRAHELTGLPARAPKHRRMRGGGDGSGGVTGGGSQLDCVPRT